MKYGLMTPLCATLVKAIDYSFLLLSEKPRNHQTQRKLRQLVFRSIVITFEDM